VLCVPLMAKVTLSGWLINAGLLMSLTVLFAVSDQWPTDCLLIEHWLWGSCDFCTGAVNFLVSRGKCN
jgi:hypothetical protein